MDAGIIFLAVFFVGIIVLGNSLCTFGDVPWWMKSKERLTYEQTQLIREIANQGRGQRTKRYRQAKQNKIQFASAEGIQWCAELEAGYVPGLVEGQR